MTNTEHVPVDDREITDTIYTEEDHEEATAAGRALRDRILADPRSRASYDRASEEIARHQMALSKLRRAKGLAQATVAETMDMDQSEVSRLERRADILISTLRRFIEATGGELRLVAHYPEGDVQVVLAGQPTGEEPVPVGPSPEPRRSFATEGARRPREVKNGLVSAVSIS